LLFSVMCCCFLLLAIGTWQRRPRHCQSCSGVCVCVCVCVVC
jgi:hypothetical protein